jgi:hypothetical protein
MSTDQERIHDGWLFHTDFREPWLLKRISTSKASAWLAEKEFDATRSLGLAAWCQVDRTFQKFIMRKRKANKRVPIFSCTKDDFKWELQRIILLTPLLISQILRFCQLVVLKVQYFSKLMQCICLCSMVLMMHVRMNRLPIWRVSDSEDNQGKRRIWVASCFLTTKIPSALLVAVAWLQRTRCPRLRRGT